MAVCVPGGLCLQRVAEAWCKVLVLVAIKIGMQHLWFDQVVNQVKMQ